MSTNSSQRCPFLRGSNGSGRFKYAGKLASDTLHFDFSCQLRGMLFNSFSSEPIQYGCFNGKFTTCECYAKQIFELSVIVPIICPLWNEEIQKCNKKSFECEKYWIDPIDNSIDDYRKCAVFSEWFWEKRVHSEDETK